MKWKFKIGDIIVWPADQYWTRSIIAKVINRRVYKQSQTKVPEFKYCLLWLEGGHSYWVSRTGIEYHYEKLGWSKKFFDLFVQTLG